MIVFCRVLNVLFLLRSELTQMWKTSMTKFRLKFPAHLFYSLTLVKWFWSIFPQVEPNPSSLQKIVLTSRKLTIKLEVQNKNMMQTTEGTNFLVFLLLVLTEQIFPKNVCYYPLLVFWEQFLFSLLCIKVQKIPVLCNMFCTESETSKGSREPFPLFVHVYNY